MSTRTLVRSEVLRSLILDATIRSAVDREWQVEPEAVDDETQARFEEQTEQRLEQIRSQLDLTGRANAASPTPWALTSQRFHRSCFANSSKSPNEREAPAS